MSKGKRLILLALVLVLVASTVMAFTGPGKWLRVKRGQDATLQLRDAGATIVDSFYNGTLNVYRKDADIGYKAPKNFKFASDILGVKFYDQKWNRVKVVTGAVYVFFKLDKADQRAWVNGRLDIYYWDTWKGQWKICPTFAVDGGAMAGCRISYFGEYALLFRDP